MPIRKKAIIFARSSGGTVATNEQITRLAQYARKNGIKVLGEVALPHCSADSMEVTLSMAMLMTSRNFGYRFDTILVTDLSRLTRATPSTTTLRRYFQMYDVALVTADNPDAGVTVLTADHVGTDETFMVEADQDREVPKRGCQASHD